MTVRFAIVGVRNYAHSHYRRIKQLEEIGEGKLVAVVVSDPVKNAKRVEELKAEGITIYDSFEQLMREGKGKVDIITLPTSIPTHGELAAKAMLAGYDVIMEKPPVPTVDEMDYLRQVEKETGKFCSVGFQFMHSLTIHKLKKMLLEGELGKLQKITCRGYWPRLESYYKRNGWAGRVIWRSQLVLDGPVHNALAHYLQNMIFLAGQTPQDSAELKTVRAEMYRGHTYIQTDDTTCLEIETVDGIKIYFYVTHCSDVNWGPIMEIHTDQAVVTWDNKENTKITYHDGKVEVFDGEGTDPYLEVFRIPARKFRGELDQLPSTLDNTRSFQVAVNGMYLSSKKIREIPAEYISEFPEKGELRTLCKDIVQLMNRACSESKLLSDIGVEWAHPTEAVNVEGLTEFNPFK
ncbi:MAG TPA: Gfo/Idh/MocA family oxidoreductase [Firmicutes bacterium]|nr:Gfo/Idh/MocA family oxidoreductase [Bacillota bacterium]